MDIGMDSPTSLRHEGHQLLAFEERGEQERGPEFMLMGVMRHFLTNQMPKGKEGDS